MEKERFQENLEKIFLNEDNFAVCKEIESVTIIDNTQGSYDFTIAIPTYNRSDLLIEAIESVLKQDINDVKTEIMVIDNDPTRGTLTERTLLRKYSKLNNFRYLKNRENLKVFGNWNRCFELAQSEWVILLHDDDMLLPSFLRIMVEILKSVKNKKELAIIKTFLITWKEGTKNDFPKLDKPRKNSLFKVKGLDYIFLGNYFGAPTCCLFNKSIMMNSGGFSKRIEPCGDPAVIFNLAMKYDVFILKQKLGIQRLGRNETLNISTLEKFMETRYYMTRYMINRYKLHWLLGNAYLNASIYDFYSQIKEYWNPNFEYDIVCLTGVSNKVLKRNFISYKFVKYIYSLIRNVSL